MATRRLVGLSSQYTSVDNGNRLQGLGQVYGDVFNHTPFETDSADFSRFDPDGYFLRKEVDYRSYTGQNQETKSHSHIRGNFIPITFQKTKYEIKCKT